MALVFASLAFATLGAADARMAMPSERHTLLARHAALPLLFVPVADDDGELHFAASTRDYAIDVSRDGLRFASIGAPTRRFALRFLHDRKNASIRGAGSPAPVHRIARDAQSVVSVEAHPAVVVEGLVPGIDVAFHASGRSVEYDVIVAPGAEPSRFAFVVDGAERVALDDAGDLVLAIGDETFVLAHPVAYQDRDGSRYEVESRFTLNDRIVGFAVGAYDRDRPLVIDPIVSYATFLGGTATEQATAIAIDAAGNAYVTGYTQSTDFPLVNAFDRTIGKRGDVEVFVSKVNATGTGLVWSTYLGGSTGTDRAVGIAVDASGSVYVTGQTSSNDFPTSTTAWQKGTTAGGGFVAKLAPAGNALVYSTYLVGAIPSAIAVDAGGNAYVTGSASSTFVTTANALQRLPGNASMSTGFLVKLNDTGTNALFSTFLGGSGGDDATSLALDARGNAFVGGWTTSYDFPLRNALQSAKQSAKDGFIAKIASDGSQFVFSTLLGGVLDDSVNAIAVDAGGNVYAAGETYSSNFPVKGGFQMRKPGFRLLNSSLGSAFVVKLAASGNALLYGSFLGGEVCQTYCQSYFGVPQIQGDVAYTVAVDAAGHAYVGGLARSYTFPLVDSAVAHKQQDNEDSAFVSKVSIAGSSMIFSTLLRTGYAEPDNKWTRFPPGAVTGIAIDAQDNAYVTGDADGASAFQATAGALRTIAAGGPDAIVVKFPATPPLTLTTSSATTDSQTPVTLTAKVAGAPATGLVFFTNQDGGVGSANLAGNVATLTTTLPPGIHALSAQFNPPGAFTDSPIVTQIVDVPLVCK